MTMDLRSDTVTRPDSGMLQAMMEAKVGDDVFGEDPSVNELESKVAEMFGMEAALFCPSGTMANQIAIKCHTQPGDEVICDKLSHVYIYEGGGIAFNSGCQVQAINGTRGKIKAEQIEEYINPPFDYKARSRLVSVENTTNRGGGSCYELYDIKKIKSICLKNNLKLHLDGARLFNALVHKNETPKQYGDLFDSISICLSKGLGTPAGSVVIGNKDFVKQARRIRKVFGGGMRQAGYLAAAGIYALENNIAKLKTDHLHAKQIADALLKKTFVKNLLSVETNIIIFELTEPYTAQNFAEYLSQHNIFVMPIAVNQIRIVTHLDVTAKMVENLTTLIDTMG